MKTPNLLEVPKSAPSARDKWKALKLANGINTHCCTGMARADHPWVACHMPSAWRIGSGYGVATGSDVFECIAHVGRLLEEAGVLVTGETERAAIRELCKNVGIPCAL